MKRFFLSVAATAVLMGCSGGNPFLEDTDTDDPDAETPIPEAITSDLDGVTYDPTNQTLVVRGITLDGTPYEREYQRRAGMDRGAYEAYTSQDASLQQHSTAYVRDIRGTRGAIVSTGGQFEHYFAGGVYGRSGSYSPPDDNSVGGRQVSYAGEYVGLINGPGSGEDLLPVAPGTPNEIRPRQGAEVTGRVLLNADFVDGRVQGGVYNRVYVDNPGIALLDLALEPTDIDGEGRFAGNVTQDLDGKGEYGGVFGGEGASEVAGALFASDHVDGFDNVEEYGLFVLPKCGTDGQDALCNQPVE